MENTSIVTLGQALQRVSAEIDSEGSVFYDAFQGSLIIAVVFGMSKEEAMGKLMEWRSKYPPAMPKRPA